MSALLAVSVTTMQHVTILLDLTVVSVMKDLLVTENVAQVQFRMTIMQFVF